MTARLLSAISDTPTDMYTNTLGLVLREVQYKESSKILTVLTPDMGKITVTSKGAVRKGSKTAASSQLLAFSEMTVFKSKDRYTLTEARTVELFTGLRDDIEKLALGTYFAELLDAVTDEDTVDPGVLSLGLNALYGVSSGKWDDRLIKAAFEMRLMCLSGFAPILDRCGKCGTDDLSAPYLDTRGGTVICSGCKTYSYSSLKLCPASLNALRYISSCDPKKLFSFAVDRDALKRLSDAAESFTSTQLERSFYTLNFYNSLRILK